MARLPVPSRLIVPLLVVWIVAAAVWNLQSADARVASFWYAGESSAPQQTQIDALLARIPATASVAATDSLDPHLSDRYTLYLMPDLQCYSAQYVAYNLSGAISLYHDDDRRMYAIMRASGRYTVIGDVDDVIVLKRVGPALDPAHLPDLPDLDG